MSLLPTVNARGLLADRPAAAAANEGYNYYATDTGILYRSNGSSWDVNSSGFANPMTTAGDLIYGGASGTPTRLGIGTAGQVLKTNAGATAPEWADESGGGGGGFGSPSAAYVNAASGGGNGTAFAASLPAAPVDGNVIILGETFQGNNQWPAITKVVQTGVDWAPVYQTPRHLDHSFAVSVVLWVGYVGPGASATITVTVGTSNWHTWVAMQFSGIDGEPLFVFGYGSRPDGSGGAAAPLVAPYVPSAGHLLTWFGGASNGPMEGTLHGGLTEVVTGRAAYRIGPPTEPRVGYDDTPTSAEAAGRAVAVWK